MDLKGLNRESDFNNMDQLLFDLKSVADGVRRHASHTVNGVQVRSNTVRLRFLLIALIPIFFPSCSQNEPDTILNSGLYTSKQLNLIFSPVTIVEGRIVDSGVGIRNTEELSMVAGVMSVSNVIYSGNYLALEDLSMFRLHTLKKENGPQFALHTEFLSDSEIKPDSQGKVYVLEYSPLYRKFVLRVDNQFESREIIDDLLKIRRNLSKGEKTY